MIKFDWPAGKAGGILVCDNVLDSDVCLTFVNYASSVIDTIGHQGKTVSGVKLEHKNSTDMVISNITIQEEHPESIQPMLRRFENEVLKSISMCVAEYRSSMRSMWEWINIVDSGFQIQRYKQNDGYYREHYDSAPWIPQLSDRVLSVVIYLNTVEIGGETKFPLHDTSVSPVIGRICLFPSNFTHPHSGNPSYTQDKWIVSTFLSSYEGVNNNNFQMIEAMHTPHHDHHDHHEDHHHDHNDF